MANWIFCPSRQKKEPKNAIWYWNTVTCVISCSSNVTIKSSSAPVKEAACHALRRRLRTDARDWPPGADCYSTESLFDWDLCSSKPFGDNAIISRHFKNSSGWLRERAEWLRMHSRGGRRRQSQSTHSLVWLKGIIDVVNVFYRGITAGVGLIRRAMTHNWMNMRGIVSHAQHGLCCTSTVVGKSSALQLKTYAYVF